MASQFLTAEKVKSPREVIEYIWDFTPFPEIAAGDTIASASVPPVSGLTIGSPTVLTTRTDGVAAGKGVQVTISGGTAGSEYVVYCTITTAGGSVREIRLDLSVN